MKETSSSKQEKKHKKKNKKEKHKKSSKHKKEKRKKHRASDSDENAKKSDGVLTPRLPTPPTTTINLDDDLSADDIKKSKEIFSKLVGKRESHGNVVERITKAKLIPSTDPDELVDNIKKSLCAQFQQTTVVSSASESDG